MNSIGNALRLTVFGESHGAAVGCTIDGLAPGMMVDDAAIRRELSRRAPRGGAATARHESDEYEVLSGVYNGKTNGAPLTAIMRSTDARSAAYSAPHIPRPSHADYAAGIKYGGFCDMRGGGMFSGRLTLPLVFAGAVARQALALRGVTVGSHIARIGDAFDESFDFASIDAAALGSLDAYFPLVDSDARESMEAELMRARSLSDSVGGEVECAAVGLPVGVGEPFFDSCESVIAHMLFSIPAVKSVEFGAGAAFSKMRGSLANDGFVFEDGRVRTIKNDSGGLNGGLANGMPLIVRAAFRPVPTIGKTQQSVDLENLKNVEYAWEGRHDACILPRGAAVVEAGVCLALLDLLYSFDREERA